MKFEISRQNIYLLALSLFLLIFVFVFSFSLLIPEGKEYRSKRTALKKESKELRNYENFRDEVAQTLSDLRAKNKNIIVAFDKNFDPSRFLKVNKNYFKTLTIQPKVLLENEEKFIVYEINTTSQINSPKSFYDFLDSVNKSDWIISVNFPINFKRERNVIRSSFTMKVYKSYRLAVVK
ncbi:hypothetical protein JHD48_04545 [Sulfurimonas sp. SAG-AH-194-I05]|nr:hypothetical protein [Sulfurimonas sp. SAG-AH-194-I05]MDF1874999.1 hypothetical protein [Sulfurimonas sp. SAG-AH-194-I05]